VVRKNERYATSSDGCRVVRIVDGRGRTATLAGQVGFQILPRRWVVEPDPLVDLPVPAHHA